MREQCLNTRTVTTRARTRTHTHTHARALMMAYFHSRLACAISVSRLSRNENASSLVSSRRAPAATSHGYTRSHNTCTPVVLRNGLQQRERSSTLCTHTRTRSSTNLPVKRQHACAARCTRSTRCSSAMANAIGFASLSAHTVTSCTHTNANTRACPIVNDVKKSFALNFLSETTSTSTHTQHHTTHSMRNMAATPTSADVDRFHCE
jgi:hypothetical protein